MNKFLIIIIMVSTIANNSYSKEIESGVYKKPYLMPKTLESKRSILESDLLNAQRRIKAFAKKYDWEKYISESFFDIAEVYDNKTQFDQRLIYLTDSNLDTKIPVTYSGVLEKRILISVSPELFSQNYKDGIEVNSFEKLLAHEIAHRLHTRVLDNDEEKMGPIWFFEGFAIFASGQFENKKLDITKEEISKILKEENRGSYIKYIAMLRYFLTKTDLKTMVKKAGDKDFTQWLESLNND